MRIIGGHDYYDGVQFQGIDKSLVFLRSQFEKHELVKATETGLIPVKYHGVLVADKNGAVARNSYVETKDGRFYLRPFAVWFAGEKHMGIRMRFDLGFWSRHRKDALVYESRTFWDADSLREFLSSIGCKLARQQWSRGFIKEENIKSFFNTEIKDVETKWMIENGVSIAVSETGDESFAGAMRSRDEHFHINVDGLGKLGFASVVPPYQAFQKLSMWYGGVIAHPGNEMIEIKDDRVKRDKHGFDNWSFKKKKALG